MPHQRTYSTTATRQEEYIERLRKSEKKYQVGVRVKNIELLIPSYLSFIAPLGSRI